MKSEIDNIQILRAVAALMVVTSHFLSGTVGGIFKYNGGFGVDIFFVIFAVLLGILICKLIEKAMDSWLKLFFKNLSFARLNAKRNDA
ncbi:hypothetical protein ACI09X_003530 [Cronobacter dublinensis]